jgi:hypothetical protein
VLRTGKALRASKASEARENVEGAAHDK